MPLDRLLRATFVLFIFSSVPSAHPYKLSLQTNFHTDSQLQSRRALSNSRAQTANHYYRDSIFAETESEVPYYDEPYDYDYDYDYEYVDFPGSRDSAKTSMSNHYEDYKRRPFGLKDGSERDFKGSPDMWGDLKMILVVGRPKNKKKEFGRRRKPFKTDRRSKEAEINSKLAAAKRKYRDAFARKPLVTPEPSVGLHKLAGPPYNDKIPRNVSLVTFKITSAYQPSEKKREPKKAPPFQQPIPNDIPTSRFPFRSRNRSPSKAGYHPSTYTPRKRSPTSIPESFVTPQYPTVFRSTPTKIHQHKRSFKNGRLPRPTVSGNYFPYRNSRHPKPTKLTHSSSSFATQHRSVRKDKFTDTPSYTFSFADAVVQNSSPYLRDRRRLSKDGRSYTDEGGPDVRTRLNEEEDDYTSSFFATLGYPNESWRSIKTERRARREI